MGMHHWTRAWVIQHLEDGGGTTARWNQLLLTGVTCHRWCEEAGPDDVDSPEAKEKRTPPSSSLPLYLWRRLSADPGRVLDSQAEMWFSVLAPACQSQAWKDGFAVVRRSLYH